MSTYSLPAGLINSDAEIFAHSFGDPAMLTNGTRIPFDDFGAELHAELERSMLQQPAKHAAIRIMVNNAGRLAELKQFTYCNHGGFDNRPDVVNGVLQEPEHWPCFKRGDCAFEGIACNSLQTPSGEFLTKREIQYTQLTAMGNLDKEIAALMNISYKTVTTHNKNVRLKIQACRKADITRFAINNNLI